jgi:hypothetical protein
MAYVNVGYKCQVKGCNYETAFPNNLSKHTNHYKGSCGDEPLLSVGGHCSTSTTPVDPPLQQLQALDCERQLDVENNPGMHWIACRCAGNGVMDNILAVWKWLQLWFIVY